MPKIKPTGYWIFNCNPQKWEIDKFLQLGEKYDLFSIMEWQKDWFKKGQLGIIRVGHDKRNLKQLAGKPRLKRGVYAIVEVVEMPKLTTPNDKKHWLNNNDAEKSRYRVGIKYLKNLINNPITLDSLKSSNINLDKRLINGRQMSSIPLNPSTFAYIVNLAGEISNMDFEFTNENEYIQENLTEEIINSKYLEGTAKEITINSYERNPSARKKCIDYYGCQCIVCGFDFEKTYGNIGANFIHVHHLNELSLTEKDYIIDPIEDLRPVCPNCHAMLHRRKPAYTINELRNIIANNK